MVCLFARASDKSFRFLYFIEIPLLRKDGLFSLLSVFGYLTSILDIKTGQFCITLQVLRLLNLIRNTQTHTTPYQAQHRDLMNKSDAKSKAALSSVVMEMIFEHRGDVELAEDRRRRAIAKGAAVLDVVTA